MKILFSVYLIVIFVGCTVSDAFSADFIPTSQVILHNQYPEAIDNFANYLPTPETHIEETDFVPEDEIHNRDTFYRQVKNSNMH